LQKTENAPRAEPRTWPATPRILLFFIEAFLLLYCDYLEVYGDLQLRKRRGRLSAESPPRIGFNILYFIYSEKNFGSENKFVDITYKAICLAVLDLYETCKQIKARIEREQAAEAQRYDELFGDFPAR
jgi:hypothetical protein